VKGRLKKTVAVSARTVRIEFFMWVSRQVARADSCCEHKPSQ